MGIVKRVSRRTARRTARRTTRRTVRCGLLLGTGILATAAVGYLLNRRSRSANVDDLPVQQVNDPSGELPAQAGSPPVVPDDPYAAVQTTGPAS